MRKNVRNKVGFMMGSSREEIKYFKHNELRYDFIFNRLEELLGNHRKVNVLDIGTSPLTFLIKDKYPEINLYTMDYSLKLKKRCEKAGITFIHQDLTMDLPKNLNNKFSIILFLEVLEHIHSDHTVVLRNLGKLLKSKGTIMLQTPNKKSLKTFFISLIGEKKWDEWSLVPQKTPEFEHFKEYFLEELVKLVKKVGGFKIIVKERPLYFDNPTSTMVYRNNKFIFYPLMAVYFLFVVVFSDFRRGMYLELQKK